ncbi:MAG: 2Fe-2S iron-sulfur cluster-binding protein [Anaerolineaceae bacterium]|jgi:succinate dehydrogenase / fumarate reductase iron-sulfur subunit|nr:2Fe-2S iron-sulfur cluster-binding protein [Anaerolineaceae bacterium]
MTQTWQVTFEIFRKKGDQPSFYDQFELEVDPDEYVLDGVERIWAFKDRSLVFSHACHHSTCGACGMLVNGVEKLTCITTIRSVTKDGGVIRVEPMRNFPVISDLSVDMTTFYQRMERVGQQPVVSVIYEDSKGKFDPDDDLLRLSDCIECGLCISACPIALTTSAYVGPAVLAGAQQSGDLNPCVLEIVDSENGAWRCHSAFECTEVCPSHVDPAWRIMNLRKQLVSRRIKKFFGVK